MRNLGVSFDDFHTFRDWGLHWNHVDIPGPEPITHYIDIPGRKTKIDATEALYGRVTFENRILTFNFWVHCRHSLWHKIDSKIQRAIGGKRCRITLDTEPEYYWLGRVTVTSERPEDAEFVLAFYTITCDCDPYKYYYQPPEEDWLWDPFSFIDGVIQQTGNIQVSGSKTVTLQGPDLPCWPVITSTANMTVRINGTSYSLTANQPLELSDVDMENKSVSFAFTGTGRVSIGFKGETL